MLGFLLSLDLVLPFLDSRALSFDNLPLLVFLADDAPLDFLVCLWKSEESWLGNTLNLFVLLHADELLLVCLEAVDVLLLDAVLCVNAELVNGDAQKSGTRSFNAGSGELLLREAPAKANASVVTRGWAVDEWAKRALGRAGCNPGRAELASVLAADLTRRVIEEGLHTPLPVLAQVVIRHAVVLAHHRKGPTSLPSQLLTKCV